MLISLCMIVKNEEKVLQRCLDSVQGLVDEIIVVDTGSTDQTKQIARQYTDKVFDFTWTNDFSAARNESLRHAVSDWILVLDADEYVQSSDHESIRETLKQTPLLKSSFTAFILPIHNFMGTSPDPNNVMISPGARIFPNHDKLRYSSPIHEQLTPRSASLSFVDLPCPIYHDGYTEQRVVSQNKSERNLSILESMKTEQKLQDPYYCYTLANQYNSSNRHDEALQLYRASWSKTVPSDNWYAHLMDSLTASELRANHFPEAYQLIETGLRLGANWVDYHYYKGVLFDQLGMHEQAQASLERALAIAEAASRRSETYWKVRPAYGTVMPLQLLGMLQFKSKRSAQAVRYWVQLLQLQPNNYRILQHLMNLLLQHEQDSGIIHIFENLYRGNSNRDTLLFLAALRSGSRSLSEHYYKRLPISLSPNDALAYALLQHQPAGISVDQCQGLQAPLALTAALIYEDASYLKQTEDRAEKCQALWTFYQQSQASPGYQAELNSDGAELLSEVLIQLLRYEYNELYSSLFQSIADAQTVNNLANRLYELGYREIAIDLYALLLDNHALAPESYSAVGQWHFLNGEVDQGLMFMEAALEEAPSFDLIGWVLNYCSQDQARQFTQKYLHVYPEMSPIANLFRL
ncbi:glycosyltransferase [Paenibacillus xylaniclasticus]|uniref:glycosyltransferase n=1 Tax=Paenibacillus xylaniclasticus TaxID=588083 RepID=UPI000FD91D55|nr:MULTISPECIES: glycosyltransferase [Paenibacillus]GFN32648.1 hypothetical protein PCURB6_29080 [Paenibacillus curdlanolyticus]